ncbi:SDR family NAD(P)-dependent oxidoreductase [Dermacoccaceae bacterium W4C1]
MSTPLLTGKRVLITGAARGIGAALAQRLHERGARLALAGLEPELLEQVAAGTGARWRSCDVSDREQVQSAVNELAAELGGLDVVVANAGIARQMPMIGGDPQVLERTLAVNTLGVYYTVDAAGPHIAHPGGYALVTSSLGAAVNLPLMGAYSASKAAVEAIGNTVRQELRPSGAKVGVAYYSELDTDMTSRGFDTESARLLLGGRQTLSGVAPLEAAIDALERGIARRSRIVCSPWWVRAALPARHLVQRVVEAKPLPRLDDALQRARTEDVGFTTEQPDSQPSTRRVHGSRD